MSKIDELESKAKAATPGEWVSPRLSEVDRFPNYITKFHPDFLARICASDSRFIAAANPQTVLALVEVVRAAKAMRNRVDNDIALMSPEEQAELLAFDAAMAKLEVKP